MSNTPATVDITDVKPRAVRVDISQVKPGDLVHDTMGRTYPVKSTYAYKHAGVRIIREDGCRSLHEHGSTITIVRKEDVR